MKPRTSRNQNLLLVIPGDEISASAAMCTPGLQVLDWTTKIYYLREGEPSGVWEDVRKWRDRAISTPQGVRNSAFLRHSLVPLNKQPSASTGSSSDSSPNGHPSYEERTSWAYSPYNCGL